MVDEEQPVGIVFPLDFSQARIVAAPVGLPKFVLEVIALAYVRSPVRHNSAEFIHALTNASSSRSTAVKSWLKSGNARIRRPLRIGHDRESKGGQHGWIRRGIFRSIERLGCRSRKPFTEVQLEMPLKN